MRWLQRLVVLSAVMLVAGSCFLHHGGAQSEEAYSAPATLFVENHNWSDVAIIALHQGQRTRLGTVTAASSKSFVFPRQLVGDLAGVRLIADAIGSPDQQTTEVIVLRPGTRVTWTLEDALVRSSLTVY